MGTLAIIRDLLFHIQGESHPIYVAEQHADLPPLRFDLNRLGSCLFFSLLLLVPILGFVQNQFGIRLSLYRDTFISVGVFLVGGLVSLGWTVPLAMLSGRGISRERTFRTWDALLVTPYPTDVILLAKAAAGIRRVWKAVVSLAFIATLPGLFVAGPVMVAMAMQTGQTPLLGVLYMGVGIIAIIAEREQEIALSVVIGLVVALGSDSRRTALVLGLVGGVLIRLVQILVTLMLAPRLAPPNIALLNPIAGTATLIAMAPGFGSLGVVIALILAREGLIRGLFAWAVHRARED